MNFWSTIRSRNILAFWLLGLTAVFTYHTMLSAALDIMHKQQMNEANLSISQYNGQSRRCDKTGSVGMVLLANILPSLLTRLGTSWWIHHIPYGFRNCLLVSSQIAALLIVALAESTSVALIGVMFSSFSSGFGEMTYSALTALYPRITTVAMQSGQGASGLLFSLIYAAMTERKFLGFSSKFTLLCMLIVPIIHSIAYFVILGPRICEQQNSADDKKEDQQINCSTKNELDEKPPKEQMKKNDQILSISSSTSSQSTKLTTAKLNKFSTILHLLPLILPCAWIFFVESLINSGMYQLIATFDQANAFGLDKSSQFRWFQQSMFTISIFIARSSPAIFHLSRICLCYILPLFQSVIFVIFCCQVLFWPFPHISFIFLLIAVEGLFGGLSVSNSLIRVHKEVPQNIREWSIAVLMSAETIGIASASFGSILLHNFICQFI